MTGPAGAVAPRRDLCAHHRGRATELGASILTERDAAPAVLIGAGLGAVAAPDLSLRRLELVVGCVLVEPPLLAFELGATEALSADAADLVREAVAAGGTAAASSATWREGWGF